MKKMTTMKKISSILFAAAIALAGCTLATPDVEAVIDSSAVRYTASFEEMATRTYVDSSLRMFWTADDRLSIFTSTYNQQYVFMGKTGGNSGEFAKVSSGGFVSGGTLSTNYAVYPYNSATSISYDGEISLTLPAVQKYGEGTFGLGANTMVAVTEDSDDTFLSFKNICGYLVVRFYGKDTIKSVTLTGNDNERIAGKATVTQLYNSNPETIIADDATTTITIDCGEGVKLGSTADAATEFWFCVPPTTFNKGFTISAEDINGRTYSKSTSASRTITRNIVNAMSALKYAPDVPYEMVDLGLSVKWASCNLGATKPEQYGRYYQWAGLQDVTSTSIDLGWSNCPYHTGSSSSTGWTKYIPSAKSSYWSGSGSPDNKTVLNPEDDVAHVKLGGKWRMPTDAEWTELRDNCTWTWTTLNGVNGYSVTSKKAGYTSKSIFLPAAGYRSGTNLSGAGSRGYFWSSSLSTGSPSGAYCVYFYPANVVRSSNGRCYGQSVRPVSE